MLRNLRWAVLSALSIGCASAYIVAPPAVLAPDNTLHRHGGSSDSIVFSIPAEGGRGTCAADEGGVRLRVDRSLGGREVTASIPLNEAGEGDRTAERDLRRALRKLDSACLRPNSLGGLLQRLPRPLSE